MNYLTNYEKYGIYEELVKTKRITICTSQIDKDNILIHFDNILNILRDGIETDVVAESFITIIFDSTPEKIDIDLTIPDYFFNLIMWSLTVFTDKGIMPYHTFFHENITRKCIKNYIDDYFIDVNRGIIPNLIMNNIIDDCMYLMIYIDEFSMYFANTINLEDMITLMDESKEFNDLIHTDISNIPLEEVKNYGMDAANSIIKYILNDKRHCLRDFFRANECINPKQFKEVFANIGSKPDGRGGIYPTVINNSFVTGGVNDPLSLLIDSGTGRVAQTIVESNVGTSGYFATLLGLNSADSYINPDPTYVCDTKNFQEVEIKSDILFKKFLNRNFRFTPNGADYCMTKDMKKDVIGRKIYLFSPMTCASASAGQGICYRCYGKLAHTNIDINIGRIASEEVSSKLTQKMLSAKHLIEAAAKSLKWAEPFEKIFALNYNAIQLIEDVDFTNWKLIIDPDLIYEENELEEMTEYNEYVNSIIIQNASGEEYNIYTMDDDNLYITPDLNEVIREHAIGIDGKIVLKLDDLKEIALFLIQIHNNELSKTLDKIRNIINKSSVTKEFNRHEILQVLLETFIEGSMDVDSIHAEVILSNQLRAIDNILDDPQWQYPNEPCKVLTLNEALKDNPSIVITLLYEKIGKALYNPLTFRKNKPSFMDLFFMEQPQIYLRDTDQIISTTKEGLTKSIEFFDEDLNKVTTSSEDVQCITKK